MDTCGKETIAQKTPISSKGPTFKSDSGPSKLQIHFQTHVLTSWRPKGGGLDNLIATWLLELHGLISQRFHIPLILDSVLLRNRGHVVSASKLHQQFGVVGETSNRFVMSVLHLFQNKSYNLENVWD